MNLIDCDLLKKTLLLSPLHEFAELIADKTSKKLKEPDGNKSAWIEALNQMPNCKAASYDFRSSTIRIGTSNELSQNESQKLKRALKSFAPWRKGPFNLFGTFIDSEWRSDKKWDRVAASIGSLRDDFIIDVGTGNGYYLFKMLADSPKRVIGLDPTLLFLFQFFALNQYLNFDNINLLPLGIEDFPPNTKCFDKVFSMGVFYHRRSPFDFLRQLKTMLKPSGLLILETLVIEGNEREVLVPEGRYANMKNVYFIPSVKAISKWLTKAGFRDVFVADVTATTVEEQRETEWMDGPSLIDALDKKDPRHTIEGHPAPLRALLIAKI